MPQPSLPYPHGHSLGDVPLDVLEEGGRRATRDVVDLNKRGDHYSGRLTLFCLRALSQWAICWALLKKKSARQFAIAWIDVIQEVLVKIQFVENRPWKKILLCSQRNLTQKYTDDTNWHIHVSHSVQTITIPAESNRMEFGYGKYTNNRSK